MPHLVSAPNVNHLWAALLVEELVRQGTTFFVVCPGSRSTPLAVAVANNPKAEALVHWDERAAGFVALGWGRATGRPAAVVTTSGTAVANLLPAAVEARQSGVPMVLLTADRPPELRETGANQAIRQPGLFATVALWAHDLGTPTPAVDPAVVLTTAAEAVSRACDGGPVHLNLPFREPLGGTPDGSDPSVRLDALGGWAGGEEPYTRRLAPTVRPEVGELAHGLHGVERGVVVLGPLDTEDAETPTAAAEIADRLGWPLLPDLLSGARLGHVPEAAVAVDLALTSATLRALHPEAVLQFGGRPTSKRVAQWIADARPDLYVHVHPRRERIDPVHRVTHRLVAPVGPVAMALDESLASRDARRTGRLGDGWRSGWRAASQAARRAADSILAESGLSEPVVARAIVRALPKGAGLVAAASMPVRDLDTYAEAGGPAVVVTANRGASGIDGTVATAAGFARGRGLPTGLLIGDLALLHDQTSLALLRDGLPVIVVCVNNDGGGIFHRLPIAHGEGRLVEDTFERFFGTPHGLTFEHAAAQAGLAYNAPESVEALEAAIDQGLSSGASVLIEVRTSREQQTALRRRIEAACAEAVDQALSGR
ncbi:2-succinyl-5-enolpyruvyl-6-hydroxy-3-cyclohexene-1-carboxylic-acid synthase [Rubrivirga marina]|uniref:2-succinyl-5-enolpyruvyl-6-hydroxy-3-cyclohexene-1-carboxylate synthase n=1 Tax=Rubrivirga marina TaxID=1196024 RepID=A0A271J6Y9_9BACT|nr:2-succinyl-5-enolpyruvyl-6-hydroxy-3-cyclohexene-1-carboxylic-acid synthase [Rubrivirga marina]